MRLFFVLALLLIANPATSKTVADLERDGQLRISSSVLPSDNIIAGQKIEMAIDIATNRWFAGGTRLRLPEVAGLVILQTNDFASNSTEQRSGQTWVIQRWTLDVYPQRNGTFSIPPVSATIAVNDERDGVVRGKLTSPAVHFEAALPKGLDSTHQWVASPSFSVTQRFDKDLERVLPGDAVSREVIFEATEVMAMMLPGLQSEKRSGLVPYPKAPELTNNSNRGITTAKRVEKITYIAESEGRYVLPAQTYYWWDTQSGTLKTRSLPEVEITVGPGSLSSKQEMVTNREPLKLKSIIYGGLFFTLLGAIFWLGLRIARSAQLTRFSQAIKNGWHRMRALAKPALPATLNPDNSAEE